MAFAGIRGTGNWATDERPKNFREMILWLNPNGQAPLTALMAKMKKEKVDDPEFAWFEEKLKPIRLPLSTTAAADATTLAVTGEGTTSTGGLSLVPGDILQVEKTETTTYDAELVMVSSVTSDTSIVVKRGVANTTAAEIASGVFLTKVGNSFMEGAGAPDISQRNPTKLVNYCQIFKTAVGVTETAKATNLRTGSAWENDKKRKSFDHSVAMEMAFMFGKAYEDTSGSKPRRFTGGLRSFITTNVTIFATTPTEATFLDAVYKVFDYTSGGGAGDERIVFCGNGFLNSLNKLAKNATNTRINFNGTLDVYGMKLQKWVLPQGTLGVKSHPLLNLHGKYTYSAFIIDPTTIRYRPLRDTKFQDNIQANDEDARKGQWITEAGLEVNFETCNAYIGNFLV